MLLNRKWEMARKKSLEARAATTIIAKAIDEVRRMGEETFLCQPKVLFN